MNRPLLNKTAIISGGTRGIGKATSLKLASIGCNIIIIYYNSHEEADELCKKINKDYNTKAINVQADVSQPSSISDAFSEIKKEFDSIDFLISNAALGILKPSMEMSLKHFRKCMETNALALNTLAQNAVPLMKEGASIVGLTSLGSERAIPNYNFIGASKAALESIARGLAQELGECKKIRVNCISAGVVDTDALKYFPNREHLLEEYAKRTPLGPTLSPEKVADAISLLCLPESSMITGQTITVDGGYSISG